MKPAIETKFGVTFGQIYLILTLIITTTITVGGVYTNINTRLTALEVNESNSKEEHKNIKTQYTEINSKLDKTNETLNKLVGAVNSNTNATNNVN